MQHLPYVTQSTQAPTSRLSPDVSLRLYADDTTLYASDVSPITLEFVVNGGLSRLSEWFDSNYLLINMPRHKPFRSVLASMILIYF